MLLSYIKLHVLDLQSEEHMYTSCAQLFLMKNFVIVPRATWLAWCMHSYMYSYLDWVKDRHDDICAGAFGGILCKKGAPQFF